MTSRSIVIRDYSTRCWIDSFVVYSRGKILPVSYKYGQLISFLLFILYVQLCIRMCN